MKELKDKFNVTLYETEVMVTTYLNNNTAFKAPFSLKEGKEKLRILDQYGLGHGWIETWRLNYYEICGILKLFGIKPPSYSELCDVLKIKETTQF